MNGKDYCKYHHGWNHPTNACWAFKNIIQDIIKKGIQEPPKEAMMVNENPFPMVESVNMAIVDMRAWLDDRRAYQINQRKLWPLKPKGIEKDVPLWRKSS